MNTCGNRIGIVTVTYNSSAVIDDFMRSIVRQDFGNFLVYVIDNASADDTVERIAAFDDQRIRVLKSNSNLGFAAGCNVGMRAALADDCTHILIINNDTVFEPPLVSGLLAAEIQLNADISVPKIMRRREPSKIWAAGGGFDPLRGKASFHFGENEIDRGQYEVPLRIEFAPGCCMLIRRDVIEKIGYFDERYFVYTEDADYCWRAKLSGINIWYVPSVVLLHDVSALTGGAGSPFISYYTTRNRVIFLRKHFPAYVTVFWLIALQLLIHWKLLSGKENWRVYKIRQQGFWKGIAVNLTA